MHKIIFILIVFIFNTYVAYGDIYTDDTPISCDIIPTNIYAVYDRNQYDCSFGYYLPANGITCESCPNGSTCFGGRFSFNENLFQGIYVQNLPDATVNNICAGNFPARLTAIYTPNEHTCPVGQYMPANTDGCVACPADSYCAGGTYTFNETVTQGIESCPNSLYSPVGSSSVAQCGRILHVGDNVVYLRSVKQTTPSLNVQIGNDIFYGNMTTADVQMNINTERKLKVRFNDTTYSIYDDTVTVPE